MCSIDLEVSCDRNLLYKVCNTNKTNKHSLHKVIFFYSNFKEAIQYTCIAASLWEVISQSGKRNPVWGHARAAEGLRCNCKKEKFKKTQAGPRKFKLLAGRDR